MDDLRVAHAVRKLCPTLELSESVAIEAGKLVKSNLREIIKTAHVFARQSKRVALSPEDINQALGLHGFEPIYGSQRFLDQRFTPVEEKGVFFAQDADISTQQANTMTLPRPPASIHIHSHWLSVEGKQPQLPENEQLISVHNQQRNQEATNNQKDSTGRKRRNLNTVRTLFGGITQGGVELRLPVEHALTAEQQAYFDKIQKFIEPVTQSKDQQEIPKDRILQTIDELQFDAALQPLVPYLIRFASQQIYLNSANLWTIELTLRMLKSLVKNQHLQLGVYSHHILPLILSCLLSESLGADLGVTNLSGLGEVRKLRELAGKVLAIAVRNFDDSITNLHCRICQKLSDCLDPNKPYSIQYGAVKGLAEMKAVEIPAVEKLLESCLSYLSETVGSLPVASADSQDAIALQSLITELLDTRPQIKHETEDENEEMLSPLQKRARKEHYFV